MSGKISQSLHHLGPPAHVATNQTNNNVYIVAISTYVGTRLASLYVLTLWLSLPYYLVL